MLALQQRIMKQILKVQSLKKYFPVYGGLLSRIIGYVKAVDDVSFEIKKGEILGMVGESGCGKTTVGRMTLRLLEPTAGKVFFEDTDLFSLKRKEMAMASMPWSSNRVARSSSPSVSRASVSAPRPSMRPPISKRRGRGTSGARTPPAAWSLI